MEDKVIVKVANVEITENMVDKTIESLRPEQQDFFRTEEGRKQLIDQMINVELINAYGESIGVLESELYRTQMERAQKDIMLNSTMTKVMEDVKVTDEEVEEEIKNENSQFNLSEVIGAKHILVDSEDKAKEIKEKIEAGERSFEEAAKEFSSCPSSQNGGDLGTFGKGMMVPEFEKASLEAELDKVTDPVKTQFGYHLIKVYQKGVNKDELKNQMLQKKQMEKYNELIKELRKKNNFD